jgi:branched-chain amino acid transport system ATP-binding protein
MMLEVAGLECRYGRARILHGVSFVLAAGEVLVLLGRNGAGKSTTLKSIIGLVRPAAGRVVFEGVDVAGWEPYRIARAGIGYVPQERRIFADLTVAENLAVGRRPAREGRAPWTPGRLYALFPNLGEAASRAAGHLSGGEQQMLAIARTLMGNPRLILLDEPSEGLAPVILADMARAIRALKADGVTIVLAEQNLRFAAGVGDRAVTIETGRVVRAGPMA